LGREILKRKTNGRALWHRKKGEEQMPGSSPFR